MKCKIRKPVSEFHQEREKMGKIIIVEHVTITKWEDHIREGITKITGMKKSVLLNLLEEKDTKLSLWKKF